MTPLRQTMIQAMCQHGFPPRTQHSYLYVVTALARYYRRSPNGLPDRPHGRYGNAL